MLSGAFCVEKEQISMKESRGIGSDEGYNIEGTVYESVKLYGSSAAETQLNFILPKLTGEYILNIRIYWLEVKQRGERNEKKKIMEIFDCMGIDPWHGFQ